MRYLAVCSVLGLGIVSSLDAGVYLKADREDLGHDPFIIVHPIGYDGTGGEIVLEICSQESLYVPALKEAIATWNNLQPETENCSSCFLLEDDPTAHDPEAPIDLKSVILHELGHCAMGLGHINWQATSFTATRDAGSISIGADNIRGSKDDRPSPLPGSRIVHWFRKADNNPFAIDETTIDSDTYTRRFLDLPSGSRWTASANRNVAEALGLSDTHGLMYSDIRRGARISELDPDSVHTVKNAMSGIDSEAGTADDYTVLLRFQLDCASADIALEKFSPQDPQDPTIGACVSTIEQIDPNNIVHYRVSQTPIIGPIPIIQINDSLDYDAVTADDFESGDFSDWTDVIP